MPAAWAFRQVCTHDLFVIGTKLTVDQELEAVEHVTSQHHRSPASARRSSTLVRCSRDLRAGTLSLSMAATSSRGRPAW
jgi:hypothetical protein